MDWTTEYTLLRTELHCTNPLPVCVSKRSIHRQVQAQAQAHTVSVLTLLALRALLVGLPCLRSFPEALESRLLVSASTVPKVWFSPGSFKALI